MAAVFVYDDQLLDYDFGPEHPLRPERLRLTHRLLAAYGAFHEPHARLVVPRPATEAEILSAHRADYIAAVQRLNAGEWQPETARYGFGAGDNPPFYGMYEAALGYTGAALTAAEQVAAGKVPVAFSPAGGLHHAFADRAAGFCIFNDCVVVIHRLLEQFDRILYVDIDAHHGDGVQAAFYRDPRVLTISLHETGETLFPQTGFPSEAGSGEGEGFSVNVPLFPGTDDDTYLWAFGEVVPPLTQAFRPQILVAQIGCDTHFQDPLAHLNLTTAGYEALIRWLHSLCDRWVALGGGGYNLKTIPRAWALAFGVMSGQEFANEVPAGYPAVRALGATPRLRDTAPPPRASERVHAYAEHMVAEVKRHVFPRHGLAARGNT
ncbi:MAG: acetoin utilization protein AcuC [Armatimonadetes bacterium]|nr:acetoin utilization protein AcuC [Armatimonadota bacterium]